MQKHNRKQKKVKENLISLEQQFEHGLDTLTKIKKGKTRVLDY